MQTDFRPAIRKALTTPCSFNLFRWLKPARGESDRTKLHRFRAIIESAKSGSLPSTPELAALYSVSEGSITRDIAALRKHFTVIRHKNPWRFEIRPLEVQK